MYIYASEKNMKIRVSVIGASGYSGQELLSCLLGHPYVEIHHLTGFSSAGKEFSAVYPKFHRRLTQTLEAYQPGLFSDSDVVFTALPSGESMNTVAEVLSHAGRVIDMSGDFRLKEPHVYKEYYHRDHTNPSLLCTAVYGLPELLQAAIASAKLVANPGCYATSILLALLPVISQKLIDTQRIMVSAQSGLSGAGRSSSVEMSFSEINENIRAYKIPHHQHLPEIETVLQSVSKEEIRISFVPQLAPLTRGIYAVLQCPLRAGTTTAGVQNLFEQYYADAPFVRVRREIPQVRDVAGTNFCDLYPLVDERTNTLIILSTLDNLIKGAAGQAVQNMNIMFGLSQELGLV